MTCMPFLSRNQIAVLLLAWVCHVRKYVRCRFLQLFWGISTGNLETCWFCLKAFTRLCFSWFDSHYIFGGLLLCKYQQKCVNDNHITDREKFFHIFTSRKKLENFAERQLLAHWSSLLSIFVSLVHLPAAALLFVQLCESLPLISLAVCSLSFQVIKQCPDKQGTLLRPTSRLKKGNCFHWLLWGLFPFTF